MGRRYSISKRQIRALRSRRHRIPLLSSGSRRSAAAFSPLALPGLVAWWKLDEASGSRADSGPNGLTLTDNNTVGSAVGLVGNAADFEAGDTEFLSRPSEAALQMGDIDFTLACLAKFESVPGAGGRTLIAKWLIGGNHREYVLLWEGTRLKFGVSSNGTANTLLSADALGEPAVDTWYDIFGWHDAAGDTINIQVNGGTVDSTAYSSGVHSDTSDLNLGALNGTATYYHDGLMDETLICKAVLTAPQRAQLRSYWGRA